MPQGRRPGRSSRGKACNAIEQEAAAAKLGVGRRRRVVRIGIGRGQAMHEGLLLAGDVGRPARRALVGLGESGGDGEGGDSGS